MPQATGAPRRGAPSFWPHIGLIMAAALFVTALFPGVRILDITVDGEIIREALAHSGDEIVFSHIHSVENSPVKEFFHLEGDGFRLVRAEMRALGAGLPTTPVGYFALVDGTFVQSFNLKLPELMFMLAPSTMPALYHAGEKIDLSVYPLGTSLGLKIVRRPLLWLQLRRIAP